MKKKKKAYQIFDKRDVCKDPNRLHKADFRMVNSNGLCRTCQRNFQQEMEAAETEAYGRY